MNQKTYCLVTGLLFALVAFLHFVRIVQGWEVVVAATLIPVWVSWLGMIVTLILAIHGLRFATRRE